MTTKVLCWFTIGRSEFPECADCLRKMNDADTVNACALEAMMTDQEMPVVMRRHLTSYHESDHR